MPDWVTPELFRGVERVGILFFGGMSIFWGYRLFDRVAAASGELAAKGNSFNIRLKNVAPGVFFAIFGMAVLITGLMRPLEHMSSKPHSSVPSPANSSDTITTKFTWQSAPIAEGRQIRYLDAIQTIKNAVKILDSKSAIKEEDKRFSLAQMQDLKIFLIGEAFPPETIQQFRERRNQIAKDPSAYKQMSKQETLQYDQILGYYSN